MLEHSGTLSYDFLNKLEISQPFFMLKHKNTFAMYEVENLTSTVTFEYEM